MKTGILTYHSVYNFGANLQVYSTIGYLKDKGFDPIVINWIPEDLGARYERSIPKTQAECHKRFMEGHMPCTDLCRTVSDIVRVIDKYDIRLIIIGSDAVLQHIPFLARIRLSKKGIAIKKKPGSDVLFPNPFWGNFIPLLKEKVPVVIMSASSQNSNFKFIRGSVRTEMRSALNRFKLITVRDKWTQRMVKYLSNGKIKPDITPDPVFAYNQNIREQFSKEEILKRFNIPDNYLLFSFRDKNRVKKEWLESFKNLAEKKNIHCVALATPDGIKFDHPFARVVDIPLSPEEWYGLIKYSSGYIGENMHPIVVALHNVVPFYAFDSYGIVKFKFFVNAKSSKIYDILDQAEFLKNWVNVLGRRYKCPAPEKVFNQIVGFDYQKCRSFSDSQQERLNAMMKNIISY